jgi:hypothetical protein
MNRSLKSRVFFVSRSHARAGFIASFCTWLHVSIEETEVQHVSLEVEAGNRRAVQYISVRT